MKVVINMEYKIEKEVVYKVAGRYYKSEEEAKKAIEYREITQKNDDFKTLIRMINRDYGYWDFHFKQTDWLSELVKKYEVLPIKDLEEIANIGIKYFNKENKGYKKFIKDDIESRLRIFTYSSYYDDFTAHWNYEKLENLNREFGTCLVEEVMNGIVARYILLNRLQKEEATITLGGYVINSVSIGEFIFWFSDETIIWDNKNNPTVSEFNKILSGYQVKAEKDKDYYIEDDSIFYNKNKIFSFGQNTARELVVTKLSKKLKLKQLKGGLEYLLSK